MAESTEVPQANVLAATRVPADEIDATMPRRQLQRKLISRRAREGSAVLDTYLLTYFQELLLNLLITPQISE